MVSLSLNTNLKMNHVIPLTNGTSNLYAARADVFGKSLTTNDANGPNIYELPNGNGSKFLK